jgi:hypothetical protein
VNGIHPSADWEYSTIEKSRILRAFNDYFYYGGLPEVHRAKSKRAMLSSLYQKIYLSDICQRNNIKNDKVKRYRVKGLVDGVMDYTLVEAESGDVPHEAVAIAEKLGIDKQWIELTRKHLNN